MLFVLGLNNFYLSISIMEDKGFVVEFERRKVFIMLEESSTRVAQVIMVRK